MTHPFREQQLSPREVRGALRRAAELAEDDPALPRVEKSMTRGELEQLGGELGLPAGAIAKALDGTSGGDGADPLGGKRSFFLGAPTVLKQEIEVAGEPSVADREDIIEDIQDVMGHGSIETVGKTMSWKFSPGFRNGRDFSIRVRSRDGRTRIVAEERIAQSATGLFIGLGVGAGIGPMGGYVAAIVKLGAIAAIFPILWIPLMLLLARTLFIGVARRRARTMNELMKLIERRAARWSSPGAGEPPRVRVVPSAPVAATSGPSREAGAVGEFDEYETVQEADERARRA
jgi:hypothetical protein